MIFFWNALLKTDLTLFRQLCDPSNNFQSVLDIICSLRSPGGRGPRLTIRVNSRFGADRGLPIIQTAQNHTLIQNNMLHPSKYYRMHLQLTARTPWGPPGAPKKVKKFLRSFSKCCFKNLKKSQKIFFSRSKILKILKKKISLPLGGGLKIANFLKILLVSIGLLWAMVTWSARVL